MSCVSEKTNGRAIASGKTAHILINADTGKPLSEPNGYFDYLRG